MNDNFHSLLIRLSHSSEEASIPGTVDSHLNEANISLGIIIDFRFLFLPLKFYAFTSLASSSSVVVLCCRLLSSYSALSYFRFSFGVAKIPERRSRGYLYHDQSLASAEKKRLDES